VLWELGTAGTQSLASEDGRAMVLAYFAERTHLEDDVRSALAPHEVEVSPVDVPEIDWIARVREGFRAFSVGSFQIVPAWERTGAGARRAIVVEPGRAFGTGSHESTRLCLRLLEERAEAGALGHVLDVGAGSGILSVASCLLDARCVVAVEIDDEAVPVLLRHVALNAVPVRIVRADGARALRPGAFDTVLANISAPLLSERAAELFGCLRPRGALLLSGLLLEDVDAVRAAYDGMGRVDVQADGTWAALVVRSPA